MFTLAIIYKKIGKFVLHINVKSSNVQYYEITKITKIHMIEKNIDPIFHIEHSNIVNATLVSHELYQDLGEEHCYMSVYP